VSPSVHRLWRPVLAAIALSAAAGCRVEIDYSRANLRCETGECPSGLVCMDTFCVEPGELPAIDATSTSADAEPTTDAETSAACDQRFGGIAGYLLCSETADTCSFNATTAGGTCTDVCAGVDSVCVTAHDNAEAAPCTLLAEEPCDTPRNSEICTCSRGPRTTARSKQDDPVTWVVPASLRER
jgi:hypothetical protein